MLTTNLDQRFNFLCFGSDPTKVDGRKFGDLVLRLTSRIPARVWRRLSWLIVSPVGQVCPFIFGWRPGVKKAQAVEICSKCMGFWNNLHIYTLPKTNSANFAPETRPLNCPKRKLSFSNHPFSGAKNVSFREGKWPARNRRNRRNLFFKKKTGPGNILSRDTAWRIKAYGRSLIGCCFDEEMNFGPL